METLKYYLAYSNDFRERVVATGHRTRCSTVILPDTASGAIGSKKLNGKWSRVTSSYSTALHCMIQNEQMGPRWGLAVGSVI